ncbi:hypothetical protein LXL04_014419 [Taraxacum kok-saghyz]
MLDSVVCGDCFRSKTAYLASEGAKFLYERRDNGRWTVVQRRKRSQAAERHHFATPFYVAGMLDSTNKEELLICFISFGDVVDIYMGSHKDRAGKNFAFNVIGKHRQVWPEQVSVCPGYSDTCNSQHFKRGDVGVGHVVGERPSEAGLSYAEVISGRRDVRATLPPTPTPIHLVAKGSSRNWLSEVVLVGKALSLDHLAAIPNHFINGDGIIESIKYVGGLNVALRFKELKIAEELLVDSGRIAWLNIIGLPPTFWDDDNLGSVTKSFGKILVHADEIASELDASIIRVGILSSKKSWINSEVVVHADAKFFNVGLMEYEHHWSPFPDPAFVIDGSDASSREFDEEGGNSDSEMEGFEPEDIEEGEIPDNPGAMDAPAAVDGGSVGSSSEDELPSEIPESVSFPTTLETGDAVKTGIEEPNYNPKASFSSPLMEGDSLLTRIGDIPVFAGQADPMKSNGLVFPISCFGPFPANFPPGPNFGTAPSVVNKPIRPLEEASTMVFRRRNKRLVPRYSPYCFKSKSRSSQPSDSCPVARAACSKETQRPLDLNFCVPSPSLSGSIRENDECSSSTAEIRKTVGIGTDVGFQIESEDPMLAQNIGEQCESTGQR